MIIEPADVWQPMYATTYHQQGGEVIRQVTVEVDCSECPMSVLLRNPGVGELVERVQDAQFIRQTTNAIEFGPDPNEWPTWWWDAVFYAEIENSRLQEAREKFKPMISHA